MKWEEVFGQNFGDKLLEGMKDLASGLGVAAEHIYGVLIRQQIIYGSALMIGCGLGLGGCIYLLRLLWRNKDKLDEMGVALTFGTIGSVVGVVLCTTYLFSGFLHCLSPEYYAIKEILNAIGGDQ